MCLGVFVQTNESSVRAKGQPTGYVIQESGCWEWVGAINPVTGYGQTWASKKCLSAHRMMYERAMGPVPEGKHLDHLCRNRKCVNPAHLEPVTHRTNVLRGMSPVAIAVRTDRCKRGHSLDADNTYTRPNGLRMCRECQRAPELRARKTLLQRQRRAFLKLAREARLV